MDNFSSKVTKALPQLTHSQKTVAAYVLENLRQIAFCTLEDMAIKIGVSTTTVIRFARQLGYGGYTDMQKDIQREIMDKSSLPERLTGEMTTNPDALLRETAENDIANIQATLAALPPQRLKETVAAILEAEHVYVLGLRSSFALAHYTTSRFGQIRPHVRLVQSVGMIFPEEIVGIGPRDVCIAFLFPRYAKTTANLIMWMRDTGVKVILFTGQNTAAVQEYGDIILPCSIKSNSFKNTYTAPMCVINYLAAAAAIESKTDALQTLRQTEEFLSRGYYLGL